MSNLGKHVHDIRKPLNTISMHAELIKMLLEGKGAEDKIIDATNKIIQQSKVCSEMLQAMFDECANEQNSAGEGNNQPT